MVNPKLQNASILSIGNELILGDIVDTNAAYLASALRRLDIKTVGIEMIPDDLQGISAAFERALARSRFVFVTGGLGPTADDLTAEGLARALGLTLEFRQEVMEAMSERLKRPLSQFSESSRKQAWLPHGCVALRNDWGTAPGVHLPVLDYQGSGEDRHVFLMPGPPHEMSQVFKNRVLPVIRPLLVGRAIRIRKFHTFGMPESVLGDRISEWMRRGMNPDVGTQYSRGVITVRLVAYGATPEEADAILAPAASGIQEALSEYIFGEDDETLAAATLKLLRKNKLTLALAESCTAGLAASKLAEVPGSSDVLLGGAVVYSNEAKVALCDVRKETLANHGAVSEQTARELAEGVRQRFGADIGVSVTGIAGPGGGSEAKPVGLVHFAVATASGVSVLEKRYLGLERNLIRELSAYQALDLVRRGAISLARV